MNSSLEHEFVNFEFAKHSSVDEQKPDILLNFGDEITLEKVDKSDKSCHRCEICEEQFSAKSELHQHYIGHLGQPRVVLKRIPSVKPVKKKNNELYELEPENTGTLKLKIKRQSSPSDLKLTLKKSVGTKDFTIINPNSDNYNTEQVVAGKQENDSGDNAEETAQDLPSKDMTNDDEENYGNENNDPNENPLDEIQERAPVDANEADSGVGSDMANPLEREETVDSQTSDNYEPTEKSTEPDEDSEALEKTCRETIENLRRLGEQTSSPEEDRADEPESTFSPATSPQPVEGPSFAWESVLEKDCSEPSVGDDPSINHESLLQNFLLEQQTQAQSDPLAGPFETEYVSLEKLAESTCRVCSEKFKDVAQLDAHKSKHGHHQCDVLDCSTLLFSSTAEVALHKTQQHGAPVSPVATSPHLSQMSPHSNSPNLPRTSPMSSPQQTSSPTFNPQQMLPPVNFDQLPAPVQQLAQQVQRMPLPQAQMPPTLPPGAATMIPGANYFVPAPGRPPMYRMPQQPMHYGHMAGHMYPYGPPASYPQMPPQMHPPMPQQITRGRYPAMVQQNVRAPRVVQNAMPRQRMKRPLTQPGQLPNSQIPKQRRMDVLLPDRNEDADCQLIAQQKRNDGIPVIQNVQGAASQPGRTDSTIHLTDSITLSVRQPAGQSQSQTNATVTKKPDASAVANVLAARGITVTPAANKNKLTASQEQQQKHNQQPATVTQRAPPAVTALNLNSAISIIPASSQRKQQQEQQQQQFAMPQNAQKKTQQNEVERPPRPPTVDLTQDPPALPAVRRGRPPSYLSRSMLACQICDKRFQTQELLTIHMSTHRTSNKLIHKCNLCPAQYPTLAALTTHKHTFHKEHDPMLQNGSIELAIPVVDLKSPHVVNRLSNLGIQSFIPLSQLSSQAGGYFGLPIVNVEGARNPATCNLGALGAMSILSLGPLKHLSNR